LLDRIKVRLEMAVITGCLVCVGLSGCTSSRPRGSTPSDSACDEILDDAAGRPKRSSARKANPSDFPVRGLVGWLICVGWEYNTKQTKAAAEVENDYKVQNQGRLPTRTTVLTYETILGESGRVSPGQKLVVSSTIEIVQGTAERQVVVEEELRLSRPDGGDLRTARKAANEIKGGGQYKTTFIVTMPEGVEQGRYPVQTTLFINGRNVVTKSLQMQVVKLPNRELIATF
jgi:hypothetical protein